MHTARLLFLSTIIVTSACQQPPADNAAPAVKAPPAPPKAEQEDAPPPNLTSTKPGFESPRAVYKQYADAFNASRWADAIAVYSQAGKPGLVLANFKALALLAGKEHPQQEAFKAVLHDFCQAHSLRCADEKWNVRFTPTLVNGGNVTNLLSDVSDLAKAKPEATYAEIMKLLQGVDANLVVPLDPTLSHVFYSAKTATGTARRSDGQTSTMSFESSPERGWVIVE